MPRSPLSLLMLTFVPMAVAAPAGAQQATGQGTTANPAVGPNLTGQISSLDPDLFYQGWRSRQLLGQPVTTKDGRAIGSVRDLIIDADGRLAALILEGGGTIGIPDAVYRVPWTNVDLTPGQQGVTVDLSGGERPRYGLFPGTEGVATLPREFRLSEVVGDYARLQTGYGYGYVADVVFSPQGRLTGVLVSRDTAAGGGTYAFAFPGTIGPWDPGASYYGLPFVTDSQAETAGLRVDPSRFKGAAL